MKMGKVFQVAIMISAVASTVTAHGRLRDPPSRSSLWRSLDDAEISPYSEMIQVNNEDHQLFCGGFTYQNNLGGKCGICGDPYDAEDKPNEAGGKYALGIIVRRYETGDWITAKVEITAHHKGYFEFRLCPWNNTTVPATQECLDQYLLDTGRVEGAKWILPQYTGSTQWFDVPLKLPDGVTCTQCVLQWKYHTGNSWGCDDECCVGCGPQEEFYGCADIAIGEDISPPSSTTSTTKTTSTTTISGGSTTTTSTTMTPPTTTTTASSGACQPGDSGLKMKDCTSFYACYPSGSYEYACPPGTVFNTANSVCDHSYNTYPPCGTKAR